MFVKIDENAGLKPTNKKFIAFEVSKDEYQRIRKEAFDMGMSISATMRYIITQYIKAVDEAKDQKVKE